MSSPIRSDGIDTEWRSTISGAAGDFVLDIAEFLGPTGGGCTLVEVVHDEAVEEFQVVTQFSEEHPDTTEVVLQLGVGAGM